ncbi:DUF421 domain-containing protein [Pseudomonas sp. UBA4194]|jgi:uncharacterized membrane protein YcaP (DUF421 family)|uniref:DUF421 domain-containing protein n=1 Tax=Pseudomonas sp. UBA4194 TaxID=1947317 RepID=UPI0025E4D60B|nr:DUF421 domain-containing protein [Pseudomonas sp. UBA4194]
MSAFDWHRILLDEVSVGFLGEVVARTLLAYIVVFLFLKIAGRRGVRQLSLFELVVILTLGSAAGDVTFYEDVPILPVIVVFIAMISFYRLTTFLTERSTRFGEWLEGKPALIIRDGQFELAALQSGNITHAEFLMELRLHGVEHLGQVRLGILEVNGDVSLYFHERQDVQPGLSILPRDHRVSLAEAETNGLYACEYCGQVEPVSPGQKPECPRCGKHVWSKALCNPRAV